MQVSFTIAGAPVAKGRPRFRVVKQRPPKKDFVQTYTHRQTAEAEARISEYAEQAMPGAPFTGAISVKLLFFVAIPKRFSKAKRERAVKCEIFPITRPDIDNYEKLVLDALGGIAYEDDNQIVKLNSSKLYSATPCTFVHIETYDRQLTQPDLGVVV